MKYLKTIPLTFALGFGGSALFIDSDPNLLKAKFSFVIGMILISVGATIFDDIREIKNKFGK